MIDKETRKVLGLEPKGSPVKMGPESVGQGKKVAASTS